MTAVDLGVEEAVVRRRPLRLVNAFFWPYLQVPVAPAPYWPPAGELQQQAERFLAEAYDRAHAGASDLEIDSEVVTGAAAAVLLDASRTAELIVVGDRGVGGFRGLRIGSVAGQLAAHATCPVLVAHGGGDPGGPVLLGVDGSPANDPAVRFAFEEAALRGVPLLALHGWTGPVSTGPGDMLPLAYDPAEVEAGEARLLAEALAGWHDKYPDVEVRRLLVRRQARTALIDAAGRAQLAVVGTRGHGGFIGLLLGSVSQAVLHHAASPVVVVPHRTRSAV
jgi:nucleotide-binding universal stress UspA family protein